MAASEFLLYQSHTSMNIHLAFFLHLTSLLFLAQLVPHIHGTVGLPQLVTLLAVYKMDHPRHNRFATIIIVPHAF